MPVEQNRQPDAPAAGSQDNPPAKAATPIAAHPERNGGGSASLSAPAPSEPAAPAEAAAKSAEEQAKQLRERTWFIFKATTENWERRWLQPLRRLFTDQEKEVLRKLEDSGFDAAARQAKLDGMKSFRKALDVVLFDHGEARRVFRKQGRQLMEAVLADKAGQEIRRYGLPPEFTVTNPRVRAWLDTKAFKFADEVNRTTEDALRDTLQEAVQAGEAVDDIAKRVEDVFDAARGFRARTIARTEVISASNQGAIEAYQQSGVVDEKEWVSSRDELVRETHRIDGEVRSLNAQFSNGLQQPGDAAGPADEVINCRCTIAPVVRR
jgi:SPP1 gp7 family putative phage head morphogenesis protein